MKPIRKAWAAWEDKSRDIHAYIGLVLVGVGVWFAWPAGSAIVVGLGLLYFAFRS